MKRILFITAFILFITWILGICFFHTGMFIHGLMIVAAIFAMQAIIINPKPASKTITAE